MTEYSPSVTLPADLSALGDGLEQAFTRDLAPANPRQTWRRKVLVIPAALALSTIGVGVAAGAGLFTGDQVAAGMTRNLLFGDVTATCTTTDRVSFDCRTTTPPPGEPAPAPVSGKEPAITQNDFTGSVYPFVVAITWPAGAAARTAWARTGPVTPARLPSIGRSSARTSSADYVAPGVRSRG